MIPTHEPCIRVDHPDRVFTHREAKAEALIREISSVHAAGRPILVGTASVAESENLAAAISEAGIGCRVLNAKNDEAEAEIVAEAGAVGRGDDLDEYGGTRDRYPARRSRRSEREQVVGLGGLYVIGTNRHESLRIDRQLRGRAGRQGDPGASRFFVSLGDPLMERFRLRDLVPSGSYPERADRRHRQPAHPTRDGPRPKGGGRARL